MEALTAGLIWPATRGGARGGLGEWAREREEGTEGADKGGATMEPCRATKKPNHWSDLASDEGGGRGLHVGLAFEVAQEVEGSGFRV